MSNLTPYDQFKSQLEASKSDFLPLLGNAENVQKFVRVVLNAVMANQELMDADRRSLVTACMKAAQDGLMTDGREAVLNIYSTRVKTGGRDTWIKSVQYLPMVGGLVKKLYESGEVTYVDAAAVYANDKFRFSRGDDPRLEHEPTMAMDAGEVIAAYVVVKLKNGEIKREVMPRRDIEAVRAASKTSGAGPWVTWYDQQAIKSVIKRAYKQLPKSEALDRLIASDNEALGFADLAADSASLLAAPTNKPLELPDYSASDFQKNLPAWSKLIKEGRAPERIIGKVNTTSRMTEDQIAALHALVPKQVDDGMATPEQVADIRARAEAALVSTKEIFNMFDIDSLEGMPATMVEAVIDFINNPAGE